MPSRWPPGSRSSKRPLSARRQKQRLIREFHYTADSWDVEHRIVTRLEYGSQGTNPCFVAPTGTCRPDLYDRLSCQRDVADNRNKEAQLDLLGTRGSCQQFLANWLRLLFAILAYTLMQRLCETALAGTELARASAATIRARLLKIGAAILCTARRVNIMLASHQPQRGIPLRRSYPCPLIGHKCCRGTLANNGGDGAVRPQFAPLPISSAAAPSIPFRYIAASIPPRQMGGREISGLACPGRRGAGILTTSKTPCRRDDVT